MVKIFPIYHYQSPFICNNMLCHSDIQGDARTLSPCPWVLLGRMAFTLMAFDLMDQLPRVRCENAIWHGLLVVVDGKDVTRLSHLPLSIHLYNNTLCNSDIQVDARNLSQSSMPLGPPAGEDGIDTIVS